MSGIPDKAPAVEGEGAGLAPPFGTFHRLLVVKVATVTLQRKRLWRGPVVVLAVAFAFVAISIYRGHQRKQQSEATEMDNQHWKKATALRAQGKHSEAISEYEQALQKLSHNSDLRHELAYELQLMGEDDEAASQLREIIKIDKDGNGFDDDAEAHLDLGRILERKDNLREALKEYCLAAEAHPDVYFYDSEVHALSKRLNLTTDECRKYLSGDQEENDVPRNIFGF